MDTATSLLPAHGRGVAGSLVSVTRPPGIDLVGRASAVDAETMASPT